MKVKDLMTRNAETLTNESTVYEAARKMAELNIGFLPVVEGDSLVGALTDRDIVVRSVAEGTDPTKTSVAGIMTKGAESVSEEQDIEDATELMKTNQIRRIVVRDASGTIAGVVALGDLAVELGDKDLYASTLERVSEPAQPAR